MRPATSNLRVLLSVGVIVMGTMGTAIGQDVPVPAAPGVLDPARVIVPSQLFVPPDGLTMDLKVLLWELGYLPSPDCATCQPLTYRFCLEVAVKCHVQGRFADSLAFTNRAVSIRATSSALYLHALNQLALGQCEDAVVTISRLKAPDTIRIDYNWMREKLSSPLTVQFNYLAEVL